jgi:hypothetical protein
MTQDVYVSRAGDVEDARGMEVAAVLDKGIGISGE